MKQHVWVAVCGLLLTICLFNSSRTKSRRVVEPGEFEIQMGGGQIGVRVSSSQALTARLKITGDVFLVK